jgi:formylmethanofuran dehydrogenase subunit D
MKKVDVILISGRTSQQGVGLEVGKTSDKYFESVNFVELSAVDAEALGVEEGDTVEVATSCGSVVAYGKRSEDLDPGMAFFPYGPWANRVFNSETDGTGMPSYKGVKATVKLAEGRKVLTLTELVERLRGEG